MSRPATGACAIGRFGVTIALLAGLCGAAAAAESGALSYRLTYHGSSTDRIKVEIELPTGTSASAFLMPRAVPMGYAEQPWAEFLSAVRAFGADGEVIDVERGLGPRWAAVDEGAAALVRVTYEVDVREMERRILEASDTSKLRDDYLGLLGYSVFGYFEGLEHLPIRLTLEGPADWPLFTTLEPRAEPGTKSVVVTAADFYELADSQIAMGPALEVLRLGDAPPLFVAGYAEAPWDIGLTGMLGRQALDALIAYFGDAPFERFSMMVEILQPLTTEHEYGFSMEHLDSATFFLGPQGALTEDSSERQRTRNLYNYAHHIAHAWIPKRCAGPDYFPFDWEFAPVLDTIWFSEGFGQYVAGVALAKQHEDGEAYLERLLDFRFRNSLETSPPSIRRMTTTELSRVASTRYGSDFRLGRSIFSRGALMAAEMDALIRTETNGAKSLQDALRHLLAWCDENGPTVPARDLLRLLEEGSGVELGDIQARWLAAQVPVAP